MIQGAVASGVRVPWGAWRGDDQKELAFPAVWSPVWLPAADAPRLERSQIEERLDSPIEALPIESIVSGKRTVGIAIDDLSRPVQASAILEPLIDRIRAAGVAERDVTVIVASGAHRVATREDFEQKIGGVLLKRVRAETHDLEGLLADTGVSLAGVPVRINQTFFRSDVRIGVCGVLPHPFAGFSGGGKIVIPGLADLDVLVRTHKYALMGFRGGGALEGNRFRADMEQAVTVIGLHWTVNVVTNSRREVAAVYAGDPIRSHRAAAEASARIGQTNAPAEPLDAILLNAYPKDTELLQIEAALLPLRTGMLGWLKPGAPIVLMGACSDGLGTHGLFGPGGRLFRVPSPKTFLGNHPLIVFAPTVDQNDAAAVFWSGYPCCRTWDDVVSRLCGHVGDRARIGVVPCAPLQVPVGRVGA